jgi:hypothetical protein
MARRPRADARATYSTKSISRPSRSHPSGGGSRAGSATGSPDDLAPGFLRVGRPSGLTVGHNGRVEVDPMHMTVALAGRREHRVRAIPAHRGREQSCGTCQPPSWIGAGHDAPGSPARDPVSKEVTDVLDQGVQLSGPVVDSDLLEPQSAQPLDRQARREFNTRAGRRERRGRQPDDLQTERHGRRPMVNMSSYGTRWQK